MKKLLQQAGYVLEPLGNIWSRSAYGGIAYSDGDETEQRIADIISHASDISVLSTELRQHCTDWASLYHLSGTRTNILRPFKNSFQGDVLEIGAGCGAITRYLGECHANVLAIEGSPRRAAIARSRTRDLENVTVLAEKFDQFQCDHQFDVVTLIGVLEYANIFTTAGNPALAMLERVRSLLKPEGKLIIAIENQLGLKYFAGAPEDHLGQPMYGIEDRYRADQPQTFGRAVIAGMLKKSGFASSNFLSPLPDYKLPVSILTEEGCVSTDFDAGAFAWQSARRDPQLPPLTCFSLELAWPSVFDNHLAIDLANSFLIVASPQSQLLVEEGVLAYHYSTERKQEFCKETVFKREGSGKISVKYNRLASLNHDQTCAKLIKFVCPDLDRYSFGTPLSLEFVRAVTSNGGSVDEVANFIKRYLEVLRYIAYEKGIRINAQSPYTMLPGFFFDMVPQNLIVLEDGSISIIDNEWEFASPVELGYLLYRTLLLSLGSISRFGNFSHTMTRGQFINAVLEAAGVTLTTKDYERYIEIEEQTIEQVTGISAKESLRSWQEYPLLVVDVREKQIATLNQAVVVRDAQINDLQKGLWEVRGELNELRNSLTAIYASRSWKITQPLRLLHRLLANRRLIWGRGLSGCKIVAQSLRQHGVVATIKKVINSAGLRRLGYLSVPRSGTLSTRNDTNLVQSPKKLTLISMIKNEKSVIETFAAHALAMFDRVIFVDHRSTDGTGAYLRSLADVHPQVEYFRFDEAGYYQSEVMTWIVKNIVGPADDSWVFFLDADEYLPFSSRAECNDELDKYASFPVISMPWLNLVPVNMETGQVKGGIFLKPKKTAIHHKIAFQPGLIPFDEYVVAQGNHALLIGDSHQQIFPAEEAFPIYHLPIRTKQQLCDKIQHGVEAYKKMGVDRGDNLGFHWDEISRIIDQKGLTDELMADMVARYGEPLLPPYGKSFEVMIQDGYSEMKLNICTTEMVLHFDENKLDICLNTTRSAEIIGEENITSKRDFQIIHDTENNNLRFRTYI